MLSGSQWVPRSEDLAGGAVMPQGVACPMGHLYLGRDSVAAGGGGGVRGVGDGPGVSVADVRQEGVLVEAPLVTVATLELRLFAAHLLLVSDQIALVGVRAFTVGAAKGPSRLRSKGRIRWQNRQFSQSARLTP